MDSNKEILSDKEKLENSMAVKGNVKYQDSFFRRLFKEPKYRKALYLILHGEDADVEDSEFENIELENVLNMDIYNDVCFTVRNRLIILMEHQSTLNKNMPVRIFLYLAEEYKRLLMQSEFSSALYSAELVKIPRPEFYVVYTGTDECGPVLNLSDAFMDCAAAGRHAQSRLELSVPVLTEDGAEGVLAEYFGLINYIKAERGRCGSLDEAVRQGIIKYQSGYEISEFIMNQKGVYDILFEQMTRDEYIERHIEATARVMAERVRQEVTQQVTQEVTQQVKKDDIVISYKMLLEAGVEPNAARQSVLHSYNLMEDELSAILQ